MKTNKDFNLFMVLVFKVLTFFQEAALKQTNLEFYDKLTKLHFRLFFGLDLVKEAAKNSSEFKKAQHRHTCMTLSLKFKKPSKKIYKLISSAFHKNLLLEVEL